MKLTSTTKLKNNCAELLYHEEAAALPESFLINHPFVDGNKRVAFAVCYIFLEINGCILDADPDWLYERIIFWIECKEDRLQTIIGDLRKCVRVL